MCSGLHTPDWWSMFLDNHVSFPLSQGLKWHPPTPRHRHMDPHATLLLPARATQSFVGLTVPPAEEMRLPSVVPGGNTRLLLGETSLLQSQALVSGCPHSGSPYCCFSQEHISSLSILSVSSWALFPGKPNSNARPHPHIKMKEQDIFIVKLRKTDIYWGPTQPEGPWMYLVVSLETSHRCYSLDQGRPGVLVNWLAVWT